MQKNIKLNTVISQDNRTLVHLTSQNENVNWSKWDNIVTSLEDYTKWSMLNTNIVGILLLNMSNTDENHTLLYEVSQRVKLLLLTNDIIQQKSAEYWNDNFDNLINISEAHNIYPYIGNIFDGTIQDALAISTVIMRYNRLILSKNINLSTLRKEVLLKHGIIIEYNKEPEQSILVLQYFKHPNNTRLRELRECLSHNCGNILLDKIVLLTEKDYSSEWAKIKGREKIEQIVIGKRLAYYDFLNYIKNSISDNYFTILANADIYFDNTLHYLWKIKMDNKMLALLRWDVQPNREDEPVLFGPRSDSQDCWIMHSKSIKEREWNSSVFSYDLGHPGCDNKFICDMMRCKFLVSNPALSIKSYHIHTSNIRNYTFKDDIKSDFYVFIDPSHITNMKQNKTPNVKPEYLTNEMVEFQVKSSSISNAITYCTLLEKENRFKWEADIENYYFDKIPIYNWKNACVTYNGLVYDLWNIYVGNYTDDADNDTYKYWNNVDINIFSQLQRCKQMLAIPFNGLEYLKKPNTYTLFYLARALRLLKQYPEASFWLTRGFEKLFNILEIDSKSLNTLTFGDVNSVYADEVIGWLPGPYELGKEDIDALRERYPKWTSLPTSKKCVIIKNNMIQNNTIQNISRVLGEDWNIDIVESIANADYEEYCGASLCIYFGGKGKREEWSKVWTLPKECCLIEFQREIELDGELQHIAHISGLKSWIYFINEESDSEIQDKIIESIRKWINKNEDELYGV